MKPPNGRYKHMHFIDFTNYNHQNPKYISIIRDPIQRYISWYYYIRNPIYIVQNQFRVTVRQLKDQHHLQPNFPGSQISYFCGYIPDCFAGSLARRLSIAKENVDRYYSVIGITEDMNTTLEVLKGFIPRFFGALSSNRTVETNVNTFKPQVSSSAYKELSKHLRLELEFYEFCKKKLYSQKNFLKYS
ncbi:uronyl 2-sulfotransferase homolog pip [Lepeophtheirus salmonis]|uniref:uronyl 2-sulfotransferase homolog pip n=1 Tax=Lepeophtheirus salmonis TaxID=72036 RepID=UPI003AF3AA33